MRTYRSFVALSTFLIAAPLAAQRTVIHTDSSTIEIIGLQRWSVKMIEDSLAKYSPTDKLTLHACAAILRQKLHFADASVSWYTNFPEYDFKPYLAITVIEPGDSAKIRYKAWKFDSVPPRTAWRDAYAALKTERAQQALQTESFFAEHLSPADSTRFAALDALHRLIVASRKPSDFDDALRTLESDSVMANRVVAAVLLANFADRDPTWWALVDAQRDPTRVSSTASMILHTLSKHPRVVDWRPVAERVRYLVDGTNLFAFNPTLETLTATSVAPSLAPTLLAGGGSLLRAKLHSGDVFGKRSVTAFLSRLSGLPAGDVVGLERWLDTFDGASR